MCCRNVYVVALFVHKCMKIAAATAAPRLQPRLELYKNKNKTLARDKEAISDPP
jgi:hypothetical protein